MYKKIIAFLLVSVIILPQLSFGGAWTLGKNKIWGEMTIKSQWSKEGFDQDSDRFRYPRDARSWNWGLYPKIEYGVSDWLTALWGMEYKEAHWKEYSRPTLPGWGPYSVKNHGVTEVNLGAKMRFIKDPVVFSGQIKWFIPIGYDDHSLGDRAEAPELSDRVGGFELRGLLGKKWDQDQFPFYMGLESGYRFNNAESICNTVPLFYEFGVWAFDWLLIKTELDCVWAHEGTGAFEKSYAVWRIGPTFQFLSGDDVTRSGNSFDVSLQYGNTFWGKNTAADQEVVLKVAGSY